MTTITKEWLQQTIAEFENTRDDIPFGLDDDDAKILIVLKQALASLDAKPVAFINGAGEPVLYGAYIGIAVGTHLYTAPPVQETGVYKDMLNIISLLENNEWAEHCASTVLGSLLESEITRLVGKERLMSVVPEEIPKGLAGQIVSLLAHNIGDKFLAQKIWNACRAALLQDGFHDLSQPVDPQIAKYEQIMLQAGWVMVPVEPTDEMIAAAMECDDVVFDSKDPTAFCVQYREIYRAMVDAAPKQEGDNR
ncbi:hypothetical protein FX474_13100 [Salmonella enterica]|nr:hypothetical protein [Salmonella enterica]